MKPRIILLILIAALLLTGLLLPNGIRAAVANNAWSVNFIRQAKSSDASAQLPPPPSSHRHASILLAQQVLTQGDLDRASAYINQSTISSDFLTLDMQANILFRQGDYLEALEIWRVMNNENKLYRAARELAAKDLHEPALFAYQILYELYPEKYTANLAAAFRNAQNQSAAIATLQQSLQIFSTSPERVTWYRYLGDIYMNQGKFSDAERAYQMALQVNHEDPRSWRNYNILCNAQRKDLPNAVACYENLVTLGPTDPAILISAGQVFEVYGLYDQALTAYQSALEIDPNQKDALEGLERLSGLN